jgi:hypothetical protein
VSEYVVVRFGDAGQYADHVAKAKYVIVDCYREDDAFRLYGFRDEIDGQVTRFQRIRDAVGWLKGCHKVCSEKLGFRYAIHLVVDGERGPEMWPEPNAIEVLGALARKGRSRTWSR